MALCHPGQRTPPKGKNDGIKATTPCQCSLVDRPGRGPGQASRIDNEGSVWPLASETIRRADHDPDAHPGDRRTDRLASCRPSVRWSSSRSATSRSPGPSSPATPASSWCASRWTAGRRPASCWVSPTSGPATRTPRSPSSLQTTMFRCPVRLVQRRPAGSVRCPASPTSGSRCWARQLTGRPPTSAGSCQAATLSASFAARVREFVEKPPHEQALRLLSTGGLWNTMVVVGRVSALWRLGRCHAPAMMHHFERYLGALHNRRAYRLLTLRYERMGVRRSQSGHLAGRLGSGGGAGGGLGLVRLRHARAAAGLAGRDRRTRPGSSPASGMRTSPGRTVPCTTKPDPARALLA